MTARAVTWIDGIAVTGQDLRLLSAALGTPDAALSARSGVRPGATDLKVTAVGTPNMSVNVAAGQAFIDGTESFAQGLFVVGSDGTVNLTVAAADATNPRFDLVVARVYSETVTVGSRRFALEVVTGAPGASPVLPPVPANSLVLAQLAVGAAATAVTNGIITDKRPFTAALGGIVPCTAATHPGASYNGQPIWETDTKRLLIWGGSAYEVVYDSGNWTTIAATSGYTSSASYRVAGGMLQLRGSIAKNTGSIGTAANVTLADAGALPSGAQPSIGRQVTVAHTFGGGSVPSVARLNINSDGSLVVVNVLQTSVTTVWLDGITVSL